MPLKLVATKNLKNVQNLLLQDNVNSNKNI